MTSLRQKVSLFSWLPPIVLFVFVVSVQNSMAAGPLSIYVVNYPLKYFAERIGGDHVRVEFPAPADVDPAYWNPDLAVISAFQKADLILLNGAGYAKWIAKVSLPRSKIVDKLKTLGVDCLVFDPCSNSPDQGDFMIVMQRNSDIFP